MTLTARSGGTYRSVTPSVRVAGVWRSVREVYARVGGVWRLIFSALSASAVPPMATGSSSAPGAVHSQDVVIVTDGGQAPFQYVWSGPEDGFVLFAEDGGATVYWSGFIGPGESASQLWTCTVTDALGAVAIVGVQVTLSRP